MFYSLSANKFDYGYILSFITVVLVSLVLELPRIRATRMIMKTAPPATHTHGDVYHCVDDVVDSVFVVTVLSPSCAHSTTCIQVKKIARKNLYPQRKLICFMINFFV